MGLVTVTISTDNEAFDDDFEHEVGRLLIELGLQVKATGLARPHDLIDPNGNTVGTLTYTPDTDDSLEAVLKEIFADEDEPISGGDLVEFIGLVLEGEIGSARVTARWLGLIE